MTQTTFRWDGAVNIPTIIAVIGACVALGSAVASAQTNINAVQERVSRISQRYEDMPERLAKIEANQQDQTERLKRIENGLDSALK